MNTRQKPVVTRRKQIDITIRAFRIADLPRIMEIERRAFPDAWDQSWFLYFFQTNPSGFMVAVRGKETVIGYAIVDIEAETKNTWSFMEKARLPPQKGHLLNIAVDEKWRRKGVGSMLLDAAINYTIERGVNDIYLEVRTENINASTFYRNRGFTETGKVLRDYYPDGGDARIMKRILSKQKPNSILHK